MKISIIGSGNVATVLGRLLKQKSFMIEEVVSRNKIHAERLAQEVNANAIENMDDLSKNSDVYIIAVNDDAVEKVSNKLNVDNKIAVHTCGSASID
ncbi:MAG TPA: NAD(P)-binding domain-containing protein, partial [Parafilimonas sp.]|nr:NAD(P)-binding domain-containing protein [Parafilimonas sp.]